MDHELIGSISNLVIACVAVIGMYQIVLTKRSLVINSKRRAAEYSADLVYKYMNEIIPLQNEEFLYRERINFPKPDISNVQASSFTIEEASQVAYKKDFIRYYKAQSNLDHTADPESYKFLRNMNAIEAFAINFMKGVADEEIAYSSVGQTYCNSVKSSYFQYSALRSKSLQSLPFQNTVDLYNVWSSRSNKNKVKENMQKLRQEMESMEDIHISPLGT
jgi:hypothetical protein